MSLPKVAPELAARLANYTLDDKARLLLREIQRPPIRSPGLRLSSQPTAQIGPRRMRQVVLTQVAARENRVGHELNQRHRGSQEGQSQSQEGQGQS